MFSTLRQPSVPLALTGDLGYCPVTSHILLVTYICMDGGGSELRYLCSATLMNVSYKLYVNKIIYTEQHHFKIKHA